MSVYSFTYLFPQFFFVFQISRMGHSELGISEAFLSHEGIELFPDLVLDVDVRVSLVTLDVQPRSSAWRLGLRDIPVLNIRRY